MMVDVASAHEPLGLDACASEAYVPVMFVLKESHRYDVILVANVKCTLT